jgi:putative methanogenesis marker protein 8
MGRHEIEVAKSRVRIEDGKVEVLSDPLVKRCPLRSHLYGREGESRETVKQVLESHIKDLGMYTSDRNFNLVDDPVSFGASEMIMDAMRDGLLDAAVCVCEGVGTVVITRPEVVETIGAHMTGIISTSPIPEIRKSLLRRGSIILDKKCTIDQVKGFQKAVKVGYRRVAITIVASRPEDAERIRAQAMKLQAEALIFAVHSTGIDEKQATRLAESCDIVWSCASQAVRDVIGPRALMQIGTGIPVFALTRLGKLIMLNRALSMPDQFLVQRAKLPKLDNERQPSPLL